MLRGSKSKAKHAVTVQNWSPHFSPPLTQRRETAIIVGVAAVPSTAASGASPPQQDYSSNRGGSVSSRRVELYGWMTRDLDEHGATFLEGSETSQSLTLSSSIAGAHRRAKAQGGNGARKRRYHQPRIALGKVFTRGSLKMLHFQTLAALPGRSLRVIIAELARQEAPTPPQQPITLQLDQRPPHTQEPSCSKLTARPTTSEQDAENPHATPTKELPGIDWKQPSLRREEHLRRKERALHRQRAPEEQPLKKGRTGSGRTGGWMRRPRRRQKPQQACCPRPGPRGSRRRGALRRPTGRAAADPMPSSPTKPRGSCRPPANARGRRRRPSPSPATQSLTAAPPSSPRLDLAGRPELATPSPEPRRAPPPRRRRHREPHHHAVAATSPSRRRDLAAQPPLSPRPRRGEMEPREMAPLPPSQRVARNCRRRAPAAAKQGGGRGRGGGG
uniref:Uncharacterized protein n=2 Tax=Oryza rufipogon TaxID=4529 RepID=A0A0E0Q7W5_ORYRU